MKRRKHYELKKKRLKEKLKLLKMNIVKFVQILEPKSLQLKSRLMIVTKEWMNYK